MYLNYYLQQLRYIVYMAPVLLIAITAHEFAHGWMSERLGDPTPRVDGRMSLNPFRHLDLILAFLSILGSGLILRFGNATSELMQTLYLLCYYSAVMNTGLGVFNLIPFPPLDGSNVLEQRVPRVEYFYMRIRPYRTWILLLLLASGVLSRPLTMANSTILGGMWEIVEKVLGFGVQMQSQGGGTIL